jgi:hypothetical protein
MAPPLQFYGGGLIICCADVLLCLHTTHVHFSVVQVAGNENGGRFDGAICGKTHSIIYKATDSDGLTDHCYFNFTVTGMSINL